MKKNTNTINFLKKYLACDCSTCIKIGSQYCEDHYTECLSCRRAIKELEDMADRLQKYEEAHENKNLIILPKGYETAKEFFQVVHFPPSCCNDTCDGCEYEIPNGCTYKPFIRKVEPSDVYRARLELLGLNLTEEEAIKELNSDE